MSQLSQSSTIPYEFSEQDQDFLEELNLVDILYPECTTDENDENTSNFFSVENQDFYDDIDDDVDDDIDDEHNYNEDEDDDNFVQVEQRDIDVLEDHKISKFKNDTCGCSEFHGAACSNILDFNELTTYRQRCMEMTVEERDLVIKSLLFCHRHTGVNIQATGKKAKLRERASQEYYFMGIRVCRTLFCFAHSISKNTLGRISKSLDDTGIVPREHGNKSKPSANSLTFAQRNQLKKFITEYATENALPLPGRLPNVPQKTVLLLPSDKKVADIHSLYNDSAEESEFRVVCLKTFRNIWAELCPHIHISKPSTDLCYKCQKYSTSFSQSGKLTEIDKEELLKQYANHIQSSQGQRNHYREQTQESKQVFMHSNPVEGSPPCSLDVEYHYSWDYAQQVHYPHHSQQVGPIYFRTPRKCHVFGVCAEGSGKQTFYLIDESQCTGKGAESVVSMSHHYLKFFGIGEKHAKIHFDNAAGQNKNNLVVWYAVWRTLTGLHQSIELSMLVAGHTKFAPDWHFGVWKVKWRDSDAETIEQVADTVRESSRGGHNIPQLIDDSEKPVCFYNWKSFLQNYFKPVKQLSKYHHFCVRSTEPGIVTCKEFFDSEEVKVNVLKQMPPKDLMPEPKTFPGLNAARQWYLFEQIGQFFKSDLAKNAVCPKPCVPKVEINLDEECDVKKGGKRKSSLLS